jgi:hypothetical protein
MAWVKGIAAAGFAVIGLKLLLVRAEQPDEICDPTAEA